MRKFAKAQGYDYKAGKAYFKTLSSEQQKELVKEMKNFFKSEQKG